MATISNITQERVVFMDTPPKKMVLVVDDDEGVLSILQHAMTLMGWQVLSAENGEHALSQWRDQIPGLDLLITDLQMPEMNGCELARRVREIHPAVPIIFVSGDSGSELAASIEALPNHRYLKKPFRTAALTALVTNLVP